MNTMFRKARSAAALLVALSATAILAAGCNSMQSEAVADHHVGPVGPTYPSMYYFDATVTPHTVLPPCTVFIMVRVWDSNGNLVEGVKVELVGPDKTSPSYTEYDGVARSVLEVQTGGGSTVGGQAVGWVIYITLNVEDTLLTIPIQVAPNG